MARPTLRLARLGLISSGAVWAALLATDPRALAQPVTGLYVAGAGGANYLQDETVRLSPAFPGGRDRFDFGYTGLGSVGYGFGDGVRVEVEGNYRRNDLRQFLGTSFPTSAGGFQENYGAMVNALFDLDIGKSWLFPYFGVGAGYERTHLSTNYNATSLEDAQNTGGTYGNFAWQAMFGLSVPVPWVVGLSMTAEYRFFSVLSPEGFHGSAVGTEGAFGPRPFGLSRGNQVITTDYNHSVLLGLRYEFNPAPPPAPPAQPVETAPAPAPARTYLVFFDWDRADLSDRARQIIAQAAQASTRVQTTRLEVDGYTDNSAAHPGPRGVAYNQALSVRRAQAVQSELVRDGVPSSIIEIHGYGESHPLVQTAADTREPQNRRVEIMMR
ncbi:OmpA family protein [Lichenicoccus sp.]|uniref:OmpA family protein n=1 Tax=Lichenicoccus sp. TaxID=2781899 RepID=UPI003D148286